MAQAQLPFFPDGTTDINANLAFEKRDDTVTYFYGHLPIFQHYVDDKLRQPLPVHFIGVKK